MKYRLKKVDTGNKAYLLYDVFIGEKQIGQINKSRIGFPEKVVWDWHCQPHGFGQAYRSKNHAVEGLMHYRRIK